MEQRRTLVIAFLIAAVVMVGGAVAFFANGGFGAPEVNVASVVESPADVPESPVVEAEPAVAPVAAPTFDIVRVDPSGQAVIAGRGQPGASVVVTANRAPIADVAIEGSGEWVAVIEEPLPTGAVEIALIMTTVDGRELRSDQVVVVSVPESRDSKPLVLLGSPGGASRILQDPMEQDIQGFALVAIDYDDAGAVIFSGKAEPDAGVRVLVRRGGELTSLGETRADANGDWSLTAGATLPPGVYDLQVDQLDANRRVTAVLAIPFERVAPEALAEVGPRTVVVQPGNSLWRIARRLYGSGWQYTVIYQANATQIRDPDLIYPGQVFDLPEDNDGSRAG